MKTKTKILLIEDDTLAVAIYEKILIKAGYGVEVLCFGNEAVERLNDINQEKKERPDLVLLDLVLPDTDGLKILEKARDGKITKDIPFFILTNYVARDAKITGLKFGAVKYLVKTDVIPSDLVKVLKEYFK